MMSPTQTHRKFGSWMSTTFFDLSISFSLLFLFLRLHITIIIMCKISTGKICTQHKNFECTAHSQHKLLVNGAERF